MGKETETFLFKDPATTNRSQMRYNILLSTGWKQKYKKGAVSTGILLTCSFCHPPAVHMHSDPALVALLYVVLVYDFLYQTANADVHSNGSNTVQTAIHSRCTSRLPYCFLIQEFMQWGIPTCKKLAWLIFWESFMPSTQEKSYTSILSYLTVLLYRKWTLHIHCN